MFQMKLILALALVSTAVLAAPVRQNLQQDFLDFLQLIPLNDIKVVVDKHLKNDPQFQAVVKYFQGPEWEQLVTPLTKSPQIYDVKKYLGNAGFDVDLIIAFMEEFLMSLEIKSHHNHPSVKKFLDDVNAIMPWEELKEMLNEKMETSPHFQEFYDKLSSERFHVLVEKALDLPEVMTVLKQLITFDVPISPVFHGVYGFLGWPQTDNLKALD